MTKSPEALVNSTPHERGLFLKEPGHQEALGLLSLSEVFFRTYSDVLKNPSYLGSSHEDIGGQERIFFADVRRTQQSGSNIGSTRSEQSIYEWLIADGQLPNRLLYLVTDGTYLTAAQEAKIPGGGYEKTQLEPEAVLDTALSITNVLKAIGFEAKANEHRDRRSKLTQRLDDVRDNPKLYRKYKELSRIEDSKAFERLYEKFHEIPEPSAKADNSHVPSGKDLDDFYNKQMQKIAKIGFSQPNSRRFDEFADFIASQAN